MKQRRGNAVDLLILLLLGAALLSGIGRFLETGTEAEQNDRNAEIILHIDKTDAKFTLCVSVGEPVYLASGEVFGEVTEIGAAGAEVHMEKDGKIYGGTWEEDVYTDTKIGIRIRGSDGEDGFLRGGKYAVLTGQRLSLYTSRAYLYGTVGEVRILNAE